MIVITTKAEQMKQYVVGERVYRINRWWTVESTSVRSATLKEV